MRRSVFCVLMAAALMVAGGCASGKRGGALSATGKDKPAAPLRVGVSPNYPPIIFRRGSKAVGVEADLARALGTALERRITFVELPWGDLIPALEEGRIDIIMSGMSVTPARGTRVTFCTPYVGAGLAAMVKSANAKRYPTRDSIVRTLDRIAIVPGTTAEAFVERECQSATLVAVPKSEDVPYFFAGNRMQLYVHDVWAIGWLVSNNEGEFAGLWNLLTKEDLAWAVRPSDPLFADVLNTILATWQEDGTLNRILDRWLPYRDKIITP